MPDARQLCRASTTVASTRTITSCPVCGTKVLANAHTWIVADGRREKRPVIPAHVRDEQGELKVARLAARTRYPGSS